MLYFKEVSTMCIHESLISKDTGDIISISEFETKTIRDGFYMCNKCKSLIAVKDCNIVYERILP